MRPRYAVSPFIATIILLVGLVAGTVWIWDTVGSSDEPTVDQFELHARV